MRASDARRRSFRLGLVMRSILRHCSMGKEHGSLDTSLGDDLRPLGKSSIQELTEPHLGVLNRPFLAHVRLPPLFY